METVPVSKGLLCLCRQMRVLHWRQGAPYRPWSVIEYGTIT